MKFTIWAKVKGHKRFYRAWVTQESKRADLIAKGYAEAGVYSEVKVVANDGYSKETIIYK